MLNSVDCTRARLPLVALLAILIALPAMARPPKKQPKKPPTSEPPMPKAKIFDESEADKRRTKPRDRTGPSFNMDMARVKRESDAASKREDAIDTLLAILEIEDPATPSYPQTLVKLADQYWQKSEDFFDKSQSEVLLREIFDAEEVKDANALAQARSKQQLFVQRQSEWRRKAIDTYRQIERDHHSYKDLDQVLYSIGYHSTVMGDKDQGYTYYAKLIRERPTSDLVPDTLLNIGDYFFGRNDFQQALAFYSKVEQFGQTRVLGYAIYKSGWCWFNLGDKAKAMNRFYDTVKWTVIASKAGFPAAIDLRAEAQKDMVRAYSFIGAPGKAVGFFKRIAPDIYMDLCESLVNIYTTDAEYRSSNKLLKSLIAEVGDDPHVFGYQREIVYNTFKAGDKTGTQTEVAEMTAVLDKYHARMEAKQKDEEMKELELLLRIIGTDYHREAEKTLERDAQLLALSIYEAYLKWFPKAPDYYTMTFNVAILAYQMKEFERAASLFEKVIGLDDKGPYTSHAAHTVLLCYYKVIQLDASEEKQGGEVREEELKAEEIPKREGQLVHAAERYLKLAAPDAEDIAEAKFAAAKIYYDYNHFDKAIPLFQDLYDNHKDFAAMQDAARLMLSVFNVTSDIDNLNKSAEQFSKDPAVAQGDLGVKITEILDQRDFNVCRKMEFEKKYEDAGNCFMKYFQDFPQSKYGDVALNNAAVMYKDAKLIEKALIASEQLYNERSGSPMAPRALYNIGNIYRAIAVYSEAAYYFELYAKNHAKHDPKLLRKALARAATYRVAMGQYDQAVANYATYYKNFSDEKNSEQVFFEIGDVYFEDKNWRAVTKHFKRYLKNYGKKKDANQGNIMAAHSKMGQAFWNSKKKKPALKEFAIALEIFERLRAEAKEAGQDLEIEARAVDAVASAKFYEGEVVLADMKAIKLKLPQKVFTERLGKKINLIAEATKRMQEVAAFGRPQWEIAAFNRIGQAYQNLADAIENAPLPKRMDEEARYMLQEEFQKKANAVRAKAIEAYRICLDRAIKNEWFNEFSENAEKNLAKLDLQYKFTREIRPTPTFYRANATPPSKVEGTAKSANVGAVSAYNSGLAAMTALDPTTALGDFKKAAEADPRFAQAHAMAGLVLEKLGKTAEAEPYLDAALKLEKFNPTAQNVHSVRAQAASDWRKSFAASRQALIGDAENLNAYQNLARTYFLQKQYDMAVLVSRQALEFDKNNAAMWNLLGLTQIKQDQVRAALQSFAKAVEVNPKSVEAQLNLGSAVLNYNDFTRALKHFDAALSVEAGNVTGLTGRAVALRGLSRFDDARSTYAEIIKALPEDPDVRYNQCLLHGEYEEKYEDALAACGEFERLAPPTHRKRKEVEQRVKGLRDTIRFMKEDAAAEPADGAEDGAADGAADNETASDNATSSDNETEPDSD